MSKLPAPIESPVEFPGDRHAPEYTREELAALLSVKRGDQFRWRGDHYIATDDASEDSCNGWRRVFIKACACNPAMPSGWSLADITASRKIAPTSAEAPPAIALRQTRNADGASVLVPAGDRPDPAPVRLVASGREFIPAGDDGESYLCPDSGAWFAYDDCEPVGDREAPTGRDAARAALADVAASLDGADLSQVAAPGARYTVSGMDCAAEGMERLRDQSEFILLAYVDNANAGSADVWVQWIEDIDSCARPDGFDYLEARQAVRTWAADNESAILAELAGARDAAQRGDLNWNDASADEFDSVTFRLYVRDNREEESGK